MTAIIELDPDILGGKPVVKGTRIPIDLILELVKLGFPRQHRGGVPPAV